MIRRIKIYQLFIICLFSPFAANGQLPPFSIGIWNQRSFNASMILEGKYQSQQTTFRNNLSEKPRTTVFNGEFSLNSNSYIWHPSFVDIDLNLGYNPGVRKDKFLVIPDHSETRNLERLQFRTSFFKERPFSFSLFSNLNHTYINREYTTNVEMIQKNFGATANLLTKYAPISMSYSNENWQQNELQTGREFRNRRNILRTEIKKSFSKNDKHNLIYSYDDYSRKYISFVNIRNINSSAQLRDHFYWGHNRKNQWNSLIWYYNQKGSQNLSRFQLNENVNIKLPRNLKYLGNFQFSKLSLKDIKSQQLSLTNRFEHQLFESLKSNIYHEYAGLDQTAYKEFSNVFSLGFDYRKRIPTGLLTINYQYKIRNDDRDNSPVTLTIIDEEVNLDDSKVVLLQNPYVKMNSILVTDITGTITYQQYIDYLLIQRGDFVEIGRLPGGQISNEQTVYVDYITDKQLSYKFNSYSNGLNIRAYLFRPLLEIYYRSFSQDYGNVEGASISILKTIQQKIYGARVSRGSLSGGFEWENYDSNIVPYRTTRLYATLGRNFLTKLQAAGTVNLRHYNLTHENEIQKFMDVSGRLNYIFSSRTKMKLTGGYRFQEGRGIDLNLTTIRGEVQTFYQHFYLTFGIEFYYRDFSGEKIKHQSGFLRIERKL